MGAGSNGDAQRWELVRLMQQHPAHVPVWCQLLEDAQAEPGGAVGRVNHKLLAPRSMQLGSLKAVLANTSCQDKAPAHWDRLSFFWQDLPLDSQATLEELYNENKAEDGRLHVQLRLGANTGGSRGNPPRWTKLTGSHGRHKEVASDPLRVPEVFHMPFRDPKGGRVQLADDSKSHVAGHDAVFAWYGHAGARAATAAAAPCQGEAGRRQERVEQLASERAAFLERRVAALEREVLALEGKLAAANDHTGEVQAAWEADVEQMLELLAAKQAADLVACAAEDRALRAEEAMEALGRRAALEAERAIAQASRAQEALAALAQKEVEVARLREDAETARKAVWKESILRIQSTAVEPVATVCDRRFAG